MSAIDAGTFDYQVTFPRSKNARKFLRKDRLDNNLRNWLKANHKSQHLQGLPKND
ncbi:hypothetical protein [Halomonas sp. HAL1]|uniref:hypothetical protein n=1 Tax=Halomonas sp. HAL1 TaxID=550984 RepID=UPI00022D2B70|nr:hypothetical protein [Halomonas sp. HAL1]EHA14778.1 hypothetical protein HAL1_14452 [Halomonas sp. HAL1]WKV93313.1 hypothetical protein Q3Y66_01350 [Halomonas sp. HAL1]